MKRAKVLTTLLVLLFIPVMGWGASGDALVAVGVPKQKSIRHFYSTNNGNISEAIKPTSVAGVKTWEVISVELHLSAAGAANDLTIIRNNVLGATYDTVLLTQDMTLVLDLFQTYDPGEMIMHTGDTLDIAWTNGSARVFGLTVKYRLK